MRSESTASFGSKDSTLSQRDPLEKSIISSDSIFATFFENIFLVPKYSIAGIFWIKSPLDLIRNYILASAHGNV